MLRRELGLSAIGDDDVGSYVSVAAAQLTVNTAIPAALTPAISASISLESTDILLVDLSGSGANPDGLFRAHYFVQLLLNGTYIKGLGDVTGTNDEFSFGMLSQFDQGTPGWLSGASNTVGISWLKTFGSPRINPGATYEHLSLRLTRIRRPLPAT